MKEKDDLLTLKYLEGKLKVALSDVELFTQLIKEVEILQKSNTNAKLETKFLKLITNQKKEEM